MAQFNLYQRVNRLRRCIFYTRIRINRLSHQNSPAKKVVSEYLHKYFVSTGIQKCADLYTLNTLQILESTTLHTKLPGMLPGQKMVVQSRVRVDLNRLAPACENCLANADKEGFRMYNKALSVTQCSTFVIGRNLNKKTRAALGLAEFLKKYIFTSHHLRKIRARYLCTSRGLDIVVQTGART